MGILAKIPVILSIIGTFFMVTIKASALALGFCSYRPAKGIASSGDVSKTVMS